MKLFICIGLFAADHPDGFLFGRQDRIFKRSTDIAEYLRRETLSWTDYERNLEDVGKLL